MFSFRVIAICTVVLCGCGPNGRDRAPPATPSATTPTQQPNSKGPATIAGSEVTLQILDYSGVEELIASHRGKIVVVDFWSTACPPCIKEFPELVALQARVGKERLAAISLSLDYDGSEKLDEIKPRVLEFLRKQHATFDNVLSSEEADVVCKKAGFAAIPAVFVYDQGGKLRERVTDAKAGGEKGLYGRVHQLVDEMLPAHSP